VADTGERRGDVQSAFDNIRLAPGDVHVWTSRTEPAQLGPNLPRYISVLSGSERERMQRFFFDRDRWAFAVAHGLVRFALSWCSPGVDPTDWTFRPESHGRPEIDWPMAARAVRFNISHSDGLIGCVVTRNADCGIDVERLNRRLNFELLARNVLTRSERDVVESMPTGQRVEQFIRLWTLKEAYAKARGLGLSLNFNSVSFHFGRDQAISIEVDHAGQDSPLDWMFQQWAPADTHIAALAIRCPPSVPAIVTHHRCDSIP